MKKIIIFVFVMFTIISCEPKKPIERLQEEAEKEIISKLNDPSSYEFISFQEDNFEREVILQRIIDIKNQIKKTNKKTLYFYRNIMIIYCQQKT